MFATSPHKSRAHYQQPCPDAPRLTIQQLEPRLTLSTIPFAGEPLAALTYDASLAGGFIEIAVIQSNGLQDNGGVRLGIVDRTMLHALNTQDLIVDSAPSGIFVLDADPVVTGLLGNVLFGDLDLNFDVELIPLPSPIRTDPGGGPTPIGPRRPVADLPMGPIAEKANLSQVQLTVLNPSLPANETANEELGQSRKNTAVPIFLSIPHDDDRVVPSRSRAVSFHMATVSPPRTIGDSAEVTPDNRTGHRPVELAQHATSRVVANQDTPSLLEQTAPARAVEISLTKQDVTEFNAREVTPSSHQPLLRHLAQPWTSPNETAPSGESSARNSERPIDREEPEQEAREHVFADWRHRDLIAAPAVVALMAGPLWVRHRRLLGEETEQHPPKRYRQTMAL